MSQFVKQSTAFTFRIGPFVDSTDGFTPETGLTLSQADFRLSKAGGAFAQKNSASAGVHDENGWYTCILNTTDTNTLGTLDIAVYESGALPVFKHFMVLPANIYDSMVAGSDLFDVSATQILGTAISTPATAGVLDVNIKNIANAVVNTGSAQLGVNVVNAGATAWNSGAIKTTTFTAGAIDAAAIAANAIGASELAADAATEIAAAVVATTLTESYATDGAAPTLQQALFAIQQFLQEKSISGTTMTVRKLDGSTTALTFTLNSSTAPTSITRAT